MDFALSEDERLIQETAREFAQKKLFPRALEFDAEEKLDLNVIREMGELGFLGITIPERYGGAGMDYIAYALVVEQLAQGCSSHTAVVELHNSLYAGPILSHGTEEQKQKYLPAVAIGQKLGAFALTEPNAGSDAAGLETTAKADGDFYILNGTKIYATDANLAHFVLTFATVDKSRGYKGITCFMVEKGTPGLTVGTIEKKMGFKASPTTELHYQDVRVPKENIIGQVGKGFSIALEALDGGRISIGCQAMGIAQAAFNLAVKYSKERKQFGKFLSEFQGIQFMLADMATDISAARNLVYHAAYLKSRGKPFILAASQAKLYASEMATRVTHKAIQILGGYGYIRDYHVERYYRDARVTELFEGTSEIQRLVIARELLKNFRN
ncbi:MAG TPA: acyl-CoA dehydrogenase [Verrucomicrobiae bacterium]|nr:acyl-CoA dehydrogenase [Verrucomicrobiae bacterium]